jgi:hypothetical protein
MLLHGSLSRIDVSLNIRSRLVDRKAWSRRLQRIEQRFPAGRTQQQSF